MRLIGPQPKGAMPRVWSLVDVALVHLRDSPVFAEVIPSKIFEAMAMGKALTEVDARAGTLGPCACHFSLFNLKRGGTQVYGMGYNTWGTLAMIRAMALVACTDISTELVNRAPVKTPVM